MITRISSGVWWAISEEMFGTDQRVWCRGLRGTQTDARDAFLELVVAPNAGPGATATDETIDSVVTCYDEDEEAWFAAYPGDLRAVAVSRQDEEYAGVVLMAHVPVPPVTSPPDPTKPPKLEEHPLPPV